MLTVEKVAAKMSRGLGDDEYYSLTEVLATLARAQAVSRPSRIRSPVVRSPLSLSWALPQALLELEMNLGPQGPSCRSWTSWPLRKLKLVVVRKLSQFLFLLRNWNLSRKSRSLLVCELRSVQWVTVFIAQMRILPKQTRKAIEKQAKLPRSCTLVAVHDNYPGGLGFPWVRLWAGKSAWSQMAGSSEAQHNSVEPKV